MASMDVNQLFQTMIKVGISDIHFKAGTPPMIRLHGRLVSSGFSKMTGPHIEELAKTLMSEDQRQKFEKDREMDMAYEVPGLARFRLNVYRQKGTVALSLRVIPLSIKPFSDLNLPTDTIQKLCENTRGLILIAGITGSGKTTTLNSMIDHINKNNAYNIVTIEDPIEYYHADAKSSIAQREIGADTDSFAKALKHVLRQDPDVIVLGEMRDVEAIQAGIMGAETGHLVLGTIHTMDAPQTLDRLVESFGEHNPVSVRTRIANVLKGVVCQRLVQGVEGNVLYPTTEILLMTSLVKKLFMEGKTVEIGKAIAQGQYYGMHTFEQDLYRLVTEKKISEEEALDASTNPDDLTLKLKGVGVEGGVSRA
ncbi:MAG TPA: PilT/PilU family type 4a pilus ATPase [Elusimicrobiota bacterium]|nr:PilT/PilU family type 4a pilus ATPase [Elusimicrobiota bacterium]